MFRTLPDFLRREVSAGRSYLQARDALDAFVKLDPTVKLFPSEMWKLSQHVKKRTAKPRTRKRSASAAGLEEEGSAGRVGGRVGGEDGDGDGDGDVAMRDGRGGL